MAGSRLWKICKNYITIVLTVCVMIYFGFANIGLFRSFASEQQVPEFTESSQESSSEESIVEEGSEGSSEESSVGESQEGSSEEPNVEESQESSSEESSVEESPEGSSEEPSAEESQESSSQESSVEESPEGSSEEPSAEESQEGSSEEPSVEESSSEEPSVEESQEGSSEEPSVEESQESSSEEPSVEESQEGSSEESGAEESQGTEEEEKITDGVAKITYTYTVFDEKEENYGEQVTETQYFAQLADIFTGMTDIREKVLQSGETEYVPTVELCKDIELIESIQNTDNLSFVLDFQGKVIRLQNEAYLDLGAGAVTFMDQIAMVSDSQPGGITGSGSKLLTGSGKWVFFSGWYENTSGNLFGEAAEIIIYNGYFISPGGWFAEKAGVLSIVDGFFTFHESLGLLAQGGVQFPDEKAFARTTQLLWDRELTGFRLMEPDYVVSVSEASTDEAGNPITVIRKSYYKEFADAWSQAVTLSMNQDSSVVTVKVYNGQITGISLSQSYTLYAGEGGRTASIMLDGMNFTRQAGYDGNLFTVGAGRLILNDCTLNCSMDAQSVAQASAIRVSGGVLVLNGSAGTVLCNNIAIPNALSGDVGAGIYLASGAQLSICGKVSVRDNLLYQADAESQEQRTTPRNIYMEEGAVIELAGSMAAESKIGITNGNDVIAGLTSFGKLKDTYFTEIMESTPVGEKPDVSSLLSVFVSDQYESYFPCFDEQKNLLFWDRDVLLLPEAGVSRIEFIILLMGLFGFIVRNIPRINRCKAAERYIMVLSVLCLVSGSAIGFYHIRQEQVISDANMAVIQEFYSSKEDNAEKIQQMSQEEVEVQAETEEETEMAEVISQQVEETVALSVVPEDGREYYGVLEIPVLDVKLPVLASFSDADMKTTPCVYHGTVSEDNLVIVGHNYDSQFGRLNEIEIGAVISLTLADGTDYFYRVCEIEELKPEQVEEMLNPNWDLTVFTCNYARDRRVAVRCRYEE